MRKLFVVLIICIVIFVFAPTTFAQGNTLQNLIDETEAGETLELKAGVYEGNVTIDTPMTIIGEEGTVIEGDKTTNVIEIESDNVTLENLEVKGSGMSRDSKEEHSGIRVMGNHTKLKNLTVKESFHGVLLNRIDDTSISNLTIIGSATTSLSEQGNGIHILRSSNNIIEHSYIEKFRDGVYVEYSDNNEINNNTMTETRYGLHYMYSDYNSFTDNHFVHNVGGATIMHSDYITLENNEFSFNQGSQSFGLLVQTSRKIDVLQNKFHLNQRGLLLEHSTGNNIEENEFFKNQIGVELWTSATSNVFSKNTFRNNTNHVLTVGGKSNNDWSDTNGNGNYWDEPMLDLDNDGVSDIPFEYTSSLGDLIESSDELAYLFLESPAVTVYEKTNDILGNQDVMAFDEYPLLLEQQSNYGLYIAISIFIIRVGIVYFIMKSRTKTIRR